MFTPNMRVNAPLSSPIASTPLQASPYFSLSQLSITDALSTAMTATFFTPSSFSASAVSMKPFTCSSHTFPMSGRPQMTVMCPCLWHLAVSILQGLRKFPDDVIAAVWLCWLDRSHLQQFSESLCPCCRV